MATQAPGEKQEYLLREGMKAYFSSSTYYYFKAKPQQSWGTCPLCHQDACSLLAVALGSAFISWSS